MKKLFFLLLLLANVAFAQKQEITPETLAQKQLEAYNAHDIDAFVEPYADDVEIYGFPDKLLYKGKETMRKDYGEFFKNAPKLHCELKNRIIQGNTVIDKEYVTGAGKPFEAVAVYQIENNKIKKVYFIQ